MAKEISTATARVLQAIIEIEDAERRGVGWQELADRVDRGIGTVQDHVDVLIAEGYVVKNSKYFGLRAVLNPNGTERPRGRE